MSPPGERFRPSERLRKSLDYQRCYRTGRRHVGELVNLHFRVNESEVPRVGITASRKVGGSVVRHRVKRRIREIFRRFPGRHRLPAVDLVVHVKPGAGEADFASLAADVERLLKGVRPLAARGPRDRRP